MKILHLYPKQTGTRPIHVSIPKRYVYFWEIGSYISKYFDTTSIDSLHPKYSIFDLTKLILKEKYDVIVMLVRVENVIQAHKFSEFIKLIYPQIKILYYGDIVNFIPKFFEKNELIDGFVHDGDWEQSIVSYLNYTQDKNEDILSGIYVKEKNKYYKVEKELDARDYPDTKEKMFQYYNEMNGKKQLTFSISRGCPYNCKFCLSTCTFGSKDRRKPVNEVIEYIKQNTDKFDSFKLFSPTFNLDHNWVKEFCNNIIENNIKISWCSTSRIDLLLDEDTIKLMAESGCYKISVGIETLNESSKYLKKEFTISQITKVAELFNKYNIILKGLIMLGIPKQTKDDIFELFDLLERNNIKIRPTAYSPMYLLKTMGEISLNEIQKFDKFTYYDNNIQGLSKEDFFTLIIDPYCYKAVLKR